jgi:ABC-type Fe3+ transport system substrate-binding protein
MSIADCGIIGRNNKGNQARIPSFILHVAICIALALLAMQAGCDKSESKLPNDARTGQVDRLVRAKWHKGLAELPTLKLVIVSAHNANIREEYAWAFSLHYALEYGQLVDIEWRDVGGGSTAIEHYLFNVYSASQTADIDILWGGGDRTFSKLAGPFNSPNMQHPEGLLKRLDIQPEVLAQIGSPGSANPELFAGLPMYDKDHRWIGSVVSGFGFIYNAGLLRKTGLTPPKTWDDLGLSQFTDLITLADPSQSGSVAQTYMLIVQSAQDWPGGWAKLLAVLSNANRITDSAGSTANSPVLGESLVASCIDFYGLMRVAESPDQLTYVSPEGQTTFTCDPIAILKNPPHPQLAQRFVDFVMSPKGQALWALPIGSPDGPVRSVLGRLPIRHDVLADYQNRFVPGTTNFYDQPVTMTISKEMARINFGILRQLVVAAGVQNVEPMRRARRRLNQLQADRQTQQQYQATLADFNALPENVATPQQMNATAERMKDLTERYNITVGWREFFRQKYQRIAG